MWSSVCNFRFTAAVAVLTSLVLAGRTNAAEPAGADGIKPLFGDKDGKAQIDLSTPDGSNAKINFPQRPETFDSLLGRKPFAPPVMPPPVLSPRRSHPSIDRQNNWVFFTPEDVINDYMSKEMMKLPEFTPDGRERSSLSAVERYYERISRGRDSAKSGSNYDPSRYDLFGRQGMGDLGERRENSPDGLIDLGRMGKVQGDLADPAFDPGWNAPNNLSEVLRSRNFRSWDDQLRERQAQQDQLDAFKRALEYRNIPTAASTPQLPGFSPASADPVQLPIPVQANPYMSASSIFGPPSAPLAPVVSALPPPYQAPWQQDPAAQLSAPTRTVPPKLDFNPPQRRF